MGFFSTYITPIAHKDDKTLSFTTLAFGKKKTPEGLAFWRHIKKRLG